MNLWEKGITTDEKVAIFTVGKDRELDLLLAKYDVLGSIAHAKMLENIGVLTKKENENLENALKEILKNIAQGNFTIEKKFEDVHSKIEYLLTQKLGATGKKIHTARSRNDQILVALHLYSKDFLQKTKRETKKLFDILIKLAQKNKNVLLPGYTHLQVAMPSSFGLWFSAYAEMLVDDMYFLNAAFKVADQNPLGSAAGYGSSFPIDRKFTQKHLGFSELKINSVAAQMSRGKLEKSIAFALSSLAGTLAKMSMDICLYLCQNFGFIHFPDDLTTGSSIMPHKKNPDIFELIRAQCNKIQSLPFEMSLITNNLPSGYHRDFQLLKERFVPAFATMLSCLEMLGFALEKVQVKNVIKQEKYKYIFSVEAVNTLVEKGLPFRDAYQKVAEDIEKGNFSPNYEMNHTHIGSIGNLFLEGIIKKMNKSLDAF